jgi:hypothetical protein
MRRRRAASQEKEEKTRMRATETNAEFLSRITEESLQEHLAKAPRMMELSHQAAAGKASTCELLELAEFECVEAMFSLPPSAPANGRHIDAFHAGCCAFRAYALILRLRSLGASPA